MPAGGLLVWWSLLHGNGGRRNFLTTLHTGVLGALLSLSTVVYYPAYGNPDSTQRRHGTAVVLP